MVMELFSGHLLGQKNAEELLAERPGRTAFVQADCDLRAASLTIYCAKLQKRQKALDKAGKCSYTDAKLKKAQTCESEK